MSSLFIAFLSAGLLSIAYEDFRYKRVHLVLLGGSSVCAVAYRLDAIERGSVDETAIGLLINVGVLLVQLIASKIYVMLVKGRDEIFFDKYIGWGDVWLLLLAAVLFSPPLFVVVYLTALVLALLYALLVRSSNVGFNDGVPLAGIMALVAWLACTADAMSLLPKIPANGLR